MKFAVGALMVLLQAPILQSQQDVSKVSVQGVVVNATTGEPLPRVQVSLVRASASSDAADAVRAEGPSGQVANSPVSTDSEGRFALRNLDPGAYRIVAARNGYARQEYGQRVLGGPGRVVILSGGQTLNNVFIPLTPAGAVTGVVRSSSGDPVSGLQVQLLKSVFDQDGQMTFRLAGGSRTNDRGEYRIYWVTPGRYYVAASSTAPALVSVPGLALAALGGATSPNEVVDRTYPMTYYPGTFEASRASAVDVGVGMELNGIDVFIPSDSLFHVRGRVTDPVTGQPPRAASVTLVPRGPAVPAPNLSSVSPYNAADGTFDLRDVVPGRYWLRVTVNPNTASAVISAAAPGRTLTDLFTETLLQGRHAAQTGVEIGRADVDNLILALSPGVSIRGTLSVEGAGLTTLPNYERLQTSLKPAVAAMVTNPAREQTLSRDGSFTLDNVLPGEYFAEVRPLPPDFYVKEVRFERADALNQPMLIRGPGTLEVLISPRGGRVEGTVRDERQAAVPGIEAVLVPESPNARADLYRAVVTDESGKFTMRGIPPGNYTVFAWEALESFEYFDRDLLSRFEGRGVPVRISESTTADVDVRLIPATTPQ